jgi:hypothetical protein
MASEQASEDVADEAAEKAAARDLAAKFKARGGEYGVVADVLEAAANADTERINKLFGTNLGAIGLENVEQKGRVDLQGSKQEHEIELEKLKSSLREKEQATAQPERAKADATTLRKEYNQIGRDFAEVYGAQKRIEAVGKNPSAAGDLALIFGYMKMLDPRSTVREGEFANAENSGGLPSRVVSQYNKIVNGERLSADIRTDFLTQAERMYETYRDTQERNNKRYAALAQQYGVDPTHVIDEMPDAKEYDKKRREKLKASLLGGGDGQ